MVKTHIDGRGTPISGWEHSADLTIYLVPIHGALTPQFVKSPLYPREGVGHDTDRYIIITVWLKIFVIIQSLYVTGPEKTGLIYM